MDILRVMHVELLHLELPKEDKRHMHVELLHSGLTGCKTETVGLCFHLQLSVSVYTNLLSRRCQFSQIC
jgi:hypothetical protein